MKSGLSKAQAAKRIYMFDKDGLVTMVSNILYNLLESFLRNWYSNLARLECLILLYICVSFPY